MASQKKKTSKKKKEKKKISVSVDPVESVKHRIDKLHLVVHPPVHYASPDKEKIVGKDTEVLELEVVVGDDNGPSRNLLGDVQNAIATQILQNPERGLYMPYKGKIGRYSAVFLGKTPAFKNSSMVESSTQLWRKIAETAKKKETSESIEQTLCYVERAFTEFCYDCVLHLTMRVGSFVPT